MINRRNLLVGASALAGAASLPFAARAQGATRQVTTLFGTYDIPVDPQRIVLMGNRQDLETLLALDLPRPVAMGYEYAFSGSHHPHVAPWVPFDPADDVAIFDWQAVTAEQVLAYEPDLILTRFQEREWQADRFGALSRVAPILPTGELPWRADLEKIAAWTDRTEALGKVFAAHDVQRDAIRSKYAGAIGTAKIAFGSVEPPVVWLANLAADIPAAQSLADLGGQLMDWPAEFISKEFPEWLEVSPENLGILSDADVLLFWAPTRDILDSFVAQNPLWSRLPQVEAGHAILAPNNVGGGSGYTIMETLRLWEQVYATLA